MKHFIIIIFALAAQVKGDCNGGMFSELTNCCNATHPCNIGQGDCDADEDCLGNLVCGRQNCGSGFFWNSTDCCTTLVDSINQALFSITRISSAKQPKPSQVDCKWGSWSTEGKCSVTCGSGMRVQRRSVVTKAQNGGSRCKGKAIKLQKCNLPPCQDFVHQQSQIALPYKSKPKFLGTWIPAGKCVPNIKGAKCGPGLQRLVRTCVDGTARKCRPTDVKSQRKCSLGKCSSENNPSSTKKLGKWKKVSDCILIESTNKCGPGKITYTRDCFSGANDPCTSLDTTKSTDCSIKCQNKLKTFGPWKKGKCTAGPGRPKCGQGTRRETRTCNPGTNDPCLKNEIIRFQSCYLGKCVEALEQIVTSLPVSTIGNGNRWNSLLKSSSISGNGNNFCNAIEGEFEAVTLINEINKERKRRGLSVIPAADDMCVTALMKGFTQKADRKFRATHDFSRTGVKDVLNMKRRNQWKFPANLIPSLGPKGSWRKPDEILGRSLQGRCYGCPQSSTGFENAHSGYWQGFGQCDKKRNLSREAVIGWINSPSHRKVMFSEGSWRKMNWRRLGAAITSNCENKGTNKERFTYWANSWFSGQP